MCSHCVAMGLDSESDVNTKATYTAEPPAATETVKVVMLDTSLEVNLAARTVTSGDNVCGLSGSYKDGVFTVEIDPATPEPSSASNGIDGATPGEDHKVRYTVQPPLDADTVEICLGPVTVKVNLGGGMVTNGDNVGGLRGSYEDGTFTVTVKPDVDALMSVIALGGLISVLGLGGFSNPKGGAGKSSFFGGLFADSGNDNLHEYDSLGRTFRSRL